MKNLILVAAALFWVGMFAYLNHYQNEMMTQGMDEPRGAPATTPTAHPAWLDRNPDLGALAERLARLEYVLVPVTPDSFEAVNRAVRENDAKTIFDLGVSLEDLPYVVEIPAPEGRSREVTALIVFTNDAHIEPNVPFRTDTPVGALGYVIEHPALHYLVLDPRLDIAQHDAPSVLLDPEQIAELHELLH